MERIVYGNDIFVNYEYTTEKEFEEHFIHDLSSFTRIKKAPRDALTRP
jgi:carbohydrate-binding DOMON domain-containing protein